MSYINVPYSVLSIKKISSLDKLVFGLIRGFPQGNFIASNQYIADTLGVSKRSIQRSVSKLKKLGYIRTKPIYENGEQVGRTIYYLKFRENE